MVEDFEFHNGLTTHLASDFPTHLTFVYWFYVYKKDEEEKRPRSMAYPRFGYKYKTIASFSFKKETPFERKTHTLCTKRTESGQRVCIALCRMHVIVFEVHFEFGLWGIWVNLPGFRITKSTEDIAVHY